MFEHTSMPTDFGTISWAINQAINKNISEVNKVYCNDFEGSLLAQLRLKIKLSMLTCSWRPHSLSSINYYNNIRRQETHHNLSAHIKKHFLIPPTQPLSAYILQIICWCCPRSLSALTIILYLADDDHAVSPVLNDILLTLRLGTKELPPDVGTKIGGGIDFQRKMDRVMRSKII